MGRAADIADLEKMLDDGESDTDLCDRAIEVVERLYEDAKRFRHSSNAPQKKRVQDEVHDLQNVLEQIARRRHAHALDKFTDYLKNKPDLT